MKRILKISAIAAISVLYCFLISMQSRTVSYAGIASSASSQTELNSAVVSNNLFCHTEQSECQAIHYSHVSRTNIKNSFNQFSVCPLMDGKLLFIKYLPYLFYPVRNIVLFKSTDIIFPFHYFW